MAILTAEWPMSELEKALPDVYKKEATGGEAAATADAAEVADVETTAALAAAALDPVAAETPEPAEVVGMGAP